VNTLVRLKLALVAIGLIIWVWGYRVDDSYLRVVGIIVLLIAVLMRFVGRPRRAKETPEDEPPAP
jgi:asparagine N-glycosylation enzyme membrane subunit Stt3